MGGGGGGKSDGPMKIGRVWGSGAECSIYPGGKKRTSSMPAGVNKGIGKKLKQQAGVIKGKKSRGRRAGRKKENSRIAESTLGKTGEGCHNVGENAAYGKKGYSRGGTHRWV